MKKFCALVMAALLGGCASKLFTGPPPSGPVKDAATAIAIAKRTVFRRRDDPSYEWQAAMKNGIWNTVATRIGTIHCGDTGDYHLDIQADTGKVVNEEDTIIVC